MTPHPELLADVHACPTVGTEHAGSIFSKPYRYGLIDPDSEWRLHRQWFEQSAMGDLLDEDFSFG